MVDGMIQSISRNISLAESYDDEARDIGWSAFLSVYGKYPAWFLWTGAGGWARAYLEIQKELLAFQNVDQFQLLHGVPGPALERGERDAQD